MTSPSQDTPSLHLTSSMPSSATLRLPGAQGFVQAVAVPTGLVARLVPAVQPHPGSAEVASPALLREEDRLGATVMAHLLLHLIGDVGEPVHVRQLHGRIMYMQEPCEWCSEIELCLQVDTLAGPVNLTAWTDPDWPGLLVSHQGGAQLMAIGGHLPEDESVGSRALTALLMGDAAAYDRCVTRGEVLPAHLAP